jgi:hypothetical protein
MKIEEQNFSEAESPQLNIGAVMRSVSDVIKDGNIVWVKSSNQQIHCGRVDKLYPETNEALVFNFDAWTHWQVSYDNIVRVGVNNFNGDVYNDWMSRLP